MLLTSIRNKLIVFSCSISLIPLVLVMMMCYQISRKTLTKNTLNELAAIAESKRMHFNCFMAARRDRVVDFSSDGFIRTRLDQMNREGVKKERTGASLNRHLLEHKKPLDSHIMAVIVLDLDGKVVAASSEELMGVDMSDHEVFTRSVDKSYGMTHVVQPECFPFLEKQCIPVSAPIVAMRGGETIGVIAVIYDIAVLNCLTTNRIGMGETGEVYLVNRNKRLLTESRFVRSAPVLLVVDTDPVRNMIEKGKETTGIYLDYRRVPVLGVSRYLQEYDWLLLAEVDTLEAFAPIRAFGIAVALLGVVTVVIVVSCGVLFAVSTAAPIVKLKYATERLAGGDLAYRTGIFSRDEIGVLAMSFN
ncbi:MAG TPA: cache domain-containing protein, partial [Candidatus Brocadiaceae bacterium]|nr:cache domain-containing protein [Candidatus Brocadiaceae bacterium]